LARRTGVTCSALFGGSPPATLACGTLNCDTTKHCLKAYHAISGHNRLGKILGRSKLGMLAL
jgi:hypothetical protein